MESNHQLNEQTHLQWVSLPLGYRPKIYSEPLICSRQGLNLYIWYFTPVLSPFELPELTMHNESFRYLEKTGLEPVLTLCKSVILPDILFPLELEYYEYLYVE